MMFRRAVQLGHFLGAAALLLMTALVTLEVVLRKMFGQSLLIVDELSGYLLVALTFFGATHSVETGGLLRVDVIYQRLAPRARAVADRVFNLTGCAICLLLAWYFLRLVLSSIDAQIVSSTMADTPVFIPQLAMPVGMALMALALLLRALRGAADPARAAPGEQGM